MIHREASHLCLFSVLPTAYFVQTYFLRVLLFRYIPFIRNPLRSLLMQWMSANRIVCEYHSKSECKHSFLMEFADYLNSYLRVAYFLLKLKSQYLFVVQNLPAEVRRFTCPGSSSIFTKFYCFSIKHLTFYIIHAMVTLSSDTSNVFLYFFRRFYEKGNS